MIAELRAQLHAALVAHSQQLTAGLTQLLSDGAAGTRGTQQAAATFSGQTSPPASEDALSAAATAAAREQRRRQLRLERERQIKQQLRQALVEHCSKLTTGLSGLLGQQEAVAAAVQSVMPGCCTHQVQQQQQQQQQQQPQLQEGFAAALLHQQLGSLQQRLHDAEAAAQKAYIDHHTQLEQAEARAAALLQECEALRGGGRQGLDHEQQYSRQHVNSQMVVQASAAPPHQHPPISRRTRSAPHMGVQPEYAAARQAVASAPGGCSPDAAGALVELDAAYQLFCDNRTLAWECYHLQGLLVRERLLAKGSAQAAGLQLATQCVELLQRLKEAKTELQVLRAALPLAADTSSSDSGVAPTLATPLWNDAAAAVDSMDGSRMSCSSSGAVVPVTSTLRESVGSVIEESRSETEALLNALAHCQERVALVYDDASWAEGVQVQLERICLASDPEELRRVVEELQAEADQAAAASLATGDMAALLSPGERLAACGAVARGKWCNGSGNASAAVEQPAGEVAATLKGAFVTTPSGHITPLTSCRATLLAHQPSRASTGPCLAAAASELAAFAASRRRTTIATTTESACVSSCSDSDSATAGRLSRRTGDAAPVQQVDEESKGGQLNDSGASRSGATPAALELISELQVAALAVLERMSGTAAGSARSSSSVGTGGAWTSRNVRSTSSATTARVSAAPGSSYDAGA